MATGPLTEQAIEAVANNLEEAAEVTRQISQHALRYFFGGIGVGGVMGFITGYRFSKEKTRAEVLKEAEKEISEIREIYRQKTVAHDNEVGKAKVEGKVEGIAEREGYVKYTTTSPSPPYKHPDVIEEVEEVEEVIEVILDEEKSKNDEWDYAEELKHRQRNPRLPYVIHQDEFSQGTAGYTKSTYTYFAVDEVLIDEGNHKIENPARFVGVENLEKFGHGTDDWDVVYIRNNALQLEIEVCRISNRSFEEDILGLNRDDIENE